MDFRILGPLEANDGDRPLRSAAPPACPLRDAACSSPTNGWRATCPRPSPGASGAAGGGFQKPAGHGRPPAQGARAVSGVPARPASCWLTASARLRAEGRARGARPVAVPSGRWPMGRRARRGRSRIRCPPAITGGAGAVARAAAGGPRVRAVRRGTSSAARGSAAGRASRPACDADLGLGATPSSPSSSHWSPPTRCASACTPSACSRSTAAGANPRRLRPTATRAAARRGARDRARPRAAAARGRDPDARPGLDAPAPPVRCGAVAAPRALRPRRSASSGARRECRADRGVGADARAAGARRAAGRRARDRQDAARRPHAALELHGEGAIVLYGRCDEELGAPYAAVDRGAAPPGRARARRACSPRHVERHGGELARLVPALARRVPDAPRAARRPTPRPSATCSSARSSGCSSRRAPRRRVVLVLDDLHWADRPTLALLRHVVAEPREPRLLVLGTYRDSDLAREHPLDRRCSPTCAASTGVERLALRGPRRGPTSSRSWRRPPATSWTRPGAALAREITARDRRQPVLRRRDAAPPRRVRRARTRRRTAAGSCVERLDELGLAPERARGDRPPRRAARATRCRARAELRRGDRPRLRRSSCSSRVVPTSTRTSCSTCSTPRSRRRCCTSARDAHGPLLVRARADQPHALRRRSAPPAARACTGGSPRRSRTSAATTRGARRRARPPLDARPTAPVDGARRSTTPAGRRAGARRAGARRGAALVRAGARAARRDAAAGPGRALRPADRPRRGPAPGRATRLPRDAARGVAAGRSSWATPTARRARRARQQPRLRQRVRRRRRTSAWRRSSAALDLDARAGPGPPRAAARAAGDGAAVRPRPRAPPRAGRRGARARARGRRPADPALRPARPLPRRLVGRHARRAPRTGRGDGRARRPRRRPARPHLGAGPHDPRGRGGRRPRRGRREASAALLALADELGQPGLRWHATYYAAGLAQTARRPRGGRPAGGGRRRPGPAGRGARRDRRLRRAALRHPRRAGARRRDRRTCSSSAAADNPGIPAFEAGLAADALRRRPRGRGGARGSTRGRDAGSPTSRATRSARRRSRLGEVGRGRRRPSAPPRRSTT